MPVTARPQCDSLKSPLRCLLRDGYGMLLFMALLALLCLVLEIGPIKSVLMAGRWGILGGLALAGMVIGGEALSRRLSGAHWWLLGIVVIGGMSCAWSIDPLYSVQRLLSFALLYLAMFVGAWAWLQRKQNLFLGAEILYLLTLVVTILSVFHLGGDDVLDRTTRATGAMGKATGAGAFAAAAIPILLWKVRYARGFSRLVAQLALLVQGYLLFFSGARGALLASSAGLLALLWFNYRNWRPLVAVMAFVMVAFAATGLVGIDMLPDYIVRKESLASGTSRVERAKALLIACAKRPLQGYGFGAGRFVISYDEDALDAYLDGDTTSRSAKALRTAHELGSLAAVQPHNDHIERLVETGILGALCFEGMWFCLFLCIPTLVGSGPGPLPDLGRCLLASMWFFFVDSMLHSGMFAIGNGPATLTWFYLLMLVATARQVQTARRSQADLRRSVVAPEMAGGPVARRPFTPVVAPVRGRAR
jgi:hypothetical protein